MVPWNLDTGLALTGPAFDLHASARALTWTDDGRTLITASAVATEAWDLRTSSMRRAVCAAVRTRPRHHVESLGSRRPDGRDDSTGFARRWG